ncbi:MAG TPA: hypothetical protein VGC97_05440 [Pyrinomonadaceae bacterium]|jgi:hypothetical protein
MNQNVLYPNQLPAPQIHFCFKCRWEGRTVSKACPRCGRHLFSQRNVRIRGVALAFLGLFLSGFMSAITFFVTALLASAAKDPKNGAKFNGDAHMLLMIYIIFGALIAGGLTAAIGGAWQAIFGRRNMVLMWICFALLLVALFVGGAFRGLTE